MNGEYLIKDVTRQPTVPTSRGLKSYSITSCDHYSINSFLEVCEVCLKLRCHCIIASCIMSQRTAGCCIVDCRFTESPAGTPLFALLQCAELRLSDTAKESTLLHPVCSDNLNPKF